MNSLPALHSKYINSNTANIYSNSIVRFLFFLHKQKYNLDTEIDEITLTIHFDNFMDSKSELSVSNKRKVIKEKFMVDFIDFEKLNDSHFMMFILLLSNNNHSLPS